MTMKPVAFLGDSLDVIRVFPRGARREAGFQLDKVQRGLDPDDWKPMTSLGFGVREIRIRDSTEAFRVIYVAMFPEAVYVLHAFRKTTQKTARSAMEIGRARLKQLKRQR